MSVHGPSNIDNTVSWNLCFHDIAYQLQREMNRKIGDFMIRVAEYDVHDDVTAQQYELALSLTKTVGAYFRMAQAMFAMRLVHRLPPRRAILKDSAAHVALHGMMGLHLLDHCYLFEAYSGFTDMNRPFVHVNLMNDIEIPGVALFGTEFLSPHVEVSMNRTRFMRHYRFWRRSIVTRLCARANEYLPLVPGGLAVMLHHHHI